eukprot:7515161-Lingulodinium_polyedra.AAC.1
MWKRFGLRSWTRHAYATPFYHSAPRLPRLSAFFEHAASAACSETRSNVRFDAAVVGRPNRQ